MSRADGLAPHPYSDTPLSAIPARHPAEHLWIIQQIRATRVAAACRKCMEGAGRGMHHTGALPPQCVVVHHVPGAVVRAGRSR